MNKKIIMWLIPFLALGLVSAVLLDFNISRTDTVNDALSLSGENCNNNVCVEDSVEVFGGETVYSSEYDLTGFTSVNIPLGIETTSEPSEGVTNTVRYLLDAESIHWGENGYIGADFEAGREEITFLFNDMTLGDLDSLVFEQYVTAGYPVSINILLDSDNDGLFTPLKDLTTGYLTEGNDAVLKGEWAYNGATAGYPQAYMNEEEYNVWTETTYDDASTLWLYENQPGAEGFNDGTLEEFKAGISRGTTCYWVDNMWHEEICEDVLINSETKVYGIQIESLGWIAESSSKVRNIEVNEESATGLTLLPGRDFDFDIVSEYDLLATGEYTLTTNINV